MHIISTYPQLRETSLERTRKAFTLIEIMISLLLVGVMLGVAVLSMRTIFAEQKLQDEMVEIKLAARQVMRDSLEKNRAYSITLNSKFFVVGPSYPAALVGAQQMSQLREVDPTKLVGKVRYFENDVHLLVKRWGEQTFRTPAPYEQWVFEPGGICEPVSLRLVREADYVNMSFNPLTAHVEDQEMQIR